MRQWSFEIIGYDTVRFGPFGGDRQTLGLCDLLMLSNSFSHTTSHLRAGPPRLIL